MKEIFKKFKWVLCETFFVEPRKIHWEQPLSPELVVNELELNALLASVETHFQVNIPDQELSKLRSVRDVVKCLERLLVR
ncbi:MAG: acyl carrier protein [Microscillaceae bacterium]|nr:acyl carrier protein [Microscillaceae bacterium]